MVRKILEKIIYNYKCKALLRVEASNMKALDLPALTASEKNELKELWGPLGLPIKDLYYRMFKALDAFNAKYVSDEMFLPYILRALNPRSYAITCDYKGMYDSLFATASIKRPVTLVKRIAGVFYDSNNRKMSLEQAVQAFNQLEAVIIKPTSMSCMGRNVRKIKTPIEQDELTALMAQYGDDFIVQQVVRQSNKTACLNSPSLNTFRVSTLNINGQTSLCTILARCGQGDVVVDNGGAGGIMIGVDAKGHFADYGYDSKYNKMPVTKTGVAFQGYVIEEVEQLVATALELHSSMLPHMGFVGWDFALDENNQPVLIEINTYNPGIQFEQLCPRTPIFGDRTQEVIDYTIKHRPHQSITI